jgi:hypothetical protein
MFRQLIPTYAFRFLKSVVSAYKTSIGISEGTRPLGISSPKQKDISKDWS